jgi:hypothetical protein
VTSLQDLIALQVVWGYLCDIDDPISHMSQRVSQDSFGFARPIGLGGVKGSDTRFESGLNRTRGFLVDNPNPILFPCLPRAHKNGCDFDPCLPDGAILQTDPLFDQ